MSKVTFNRETFINRRNSLKKGVKSGVILLTGNMESSKNYPDNTYSFRQDSSFLYFFGLDAPNINGVIDIDEDREYIFANDVDIEDIIWVGPQVSVSEQAATVGVSNSGSLSKLAEYITKVIASGRDIHFLPPYRGANMMLLERLLGIHTSKLKAYASKILVKSIIDIRSVKEAQEIIEIEKACNIGYNMHTTAMRMCHQGTPEQKIAGVIEGIAISEGGLSSFPTILSQHGETLHNHDHSGVLTPGKLMLVDAGAESLSHYASDNTRATPVGGKFTSKQEDVYNIVLSALNGTIDITRPEVTYKEVHLEAARIITEGLQGLGIMKGNIEESVNSGAHALFFPHGLGHMMGLDVHDMEDLGQLNVGYDDEVKQSSQFGLANLRLGRRLKPGFVITNEPGVYFIPALIDKWKSESINSSFINFDKLDSYRDFGGIRLEDDILITDTGCRMLGDKRIPITPEEIEEMVNS